VNFDIRKAKAVVTAVAPRAASEESDLVVAVSIDLSDISLESVAGALRCDPEDVAELFQPKERDDAEASRFPNLKHMVCTEGWKRKHEVKIGTSKKLRVMSITGIQIRPRGKGLCDMSLVVTIEQPPEGYVEEMADKLRHSCWFDMVQVEAELPLQQRDDKPAETLDMIDLQDKPKRGRPKKAAAE
jgi:hypothetical protein